MTTTDLEGREGYVTNAICCPCGAELVVIWDHQASDGSDPVPYSCTECSWTDGVAE